MSPSADAFSRTIPEACDSNAWTELLTNAVLNFSDSSATGALWIAPILLSCDQLSPLSLPFTLLHKCSPGRPPLRTMIR